MWRRAWRAICLSDNPAVLTAWSNDHSFDTVFARQVEAYGEKDAVLLGLSTSGKSHSVVAAFEQARRMALLKANIARFVKGQPLLNVVDKQKGY